MRARIHIERLTVEGRSRSDAVRIGDALRARLTELGSTGFAPAASSIARMQAGDVARGATPEEIGRQTAGRIFQAMKGGPDA